MEEAQDESFYYTLYSLIAPDTPFRFFQGKAGHILPIHNINALLGGMFKFAGSMIAASIVQGGRRVRLMHIYKLKTYMMCMLLQRLMTYQTQLLLTLLSR